MRKPLLLIGGGGHCKACIDVIEAEGNYIIKGILDAKDKIGSFVLNYPVIASDDSLDKYIEQGFSFLITVGQIKSAQIRKKLYNILIEKKASIPTIISPKAYVSRYAEVGEGTIVMHGVHLNAGSKVSHNVILNTGCLVEHDAEIGSHCHISTHTVINGECKIGDEVFIGSNSVLANGIEIGQEVCIGAGSVVIQSISEKGTYAGSPARKVD